MNISFKIFALGTENIPITSLDIFLEYNGNIAVAVAVKNYDFSKFIDFLKKLLVISG